MSDLEIYNHVGKFRNRLDPDTEMIGTIRGEDGEVCIIMYNPTHKIHYYLSYIRRWYDTFGRQFGLGDQLGESVSEPTIRAAVINKDSWIVILKPIDKLYRPVPDLVFYGCNAQAWFDYCVANHTIRPPNGRTMNNWSIPITKLINMEGFMLESKREKTTDQS